MKKKLFAALLAVYLLMTLASSVLASQVSPAEAETTTEVSSNIVQNDAEEVAIGSTGEASTGTPTPSEKTGKPAEAEEKPTFIDTFKKNFYNTFIRENRWQMFLEGFGNTVFIAICSTLLGVLIGMIVALIKVFKAQIDRPNIAVNALNAICSLYTTVIRGTPAVVQLFIAYYIIFKSTDNYILVSIFAFGINSGAYVSEIIRAGIVAIDRGQLEAGRSLGLSHIQTMIFIVLPQAIKNILPSLGNEFILLLKDTSIAGYIGTTELMKAGNIVRSRTFEPYFSLLSVAAVYLVCVIGMEQVLKYFERRLAKSDRH